MLGRRLPHAHETILLKHRLKTEDAERNRQAKAEQAELNRIQRERENRQKADAARNAAIEKQHAEKERSMYGTPETEYQGGNNLSADTLWVKHYATPLPIAALPHPSDPEYSEAPVCFAPGLMRARNGNLSGDAEWMSQAKDTKKVWDEIKGRYSTLLGKLRSDNWWRTLCEDAGVTRSDKPKDMPWEGQYAAGTYKLTTIHVPTIKSVRVAEDGLRIVVRRNSDAARDWIARLDYLRAGFKGAGMNSSNLRISETISGDIELMFDDCPSSFPAAVSIDPPTSPPRTLADALARYEHTKWTFGVDNRASALQYSLEDFPHALVVGGTGAGKSVWARSVIEMFRTGYRDPVSGRDVGGGFTCFISSGKITDFVTLNGLPGVAMVAGDPAQTAVMVRTVREEAERRFDLAKDAKLRNDNRAFDFPPILMLLDEWGATAMALSGGYKSMDPFLTDIDLTLRVGREARVHVGLLSQTIRKQGAGSVPGSWQANLGLAVSLGKPEAETYNNPGVFTELTRAPAMTLGNRIAGVKGRGMIVQGEKLVEFQSYYVWSPGTTSLDPEADKKVAPPTAAVRETWEKWVPVSKEVPWLMPRVGIRVTDPDWSRGEDGKKPDLDTVAATPTVALTDRLGNPKPGMEKYDPWSTEWLGAKKTKRTTALGFDDDDPAPSAVPVPVRTEQEPPAGAEPDPLAGVSPEELSAALALVKKSRTAQPAADPGGSPDPPTAGTPREPPGTPEQPEQPTISYAEDENEW